MAKFKLNFYYPTSNQLYRDIEFDCMDVNDVVRIVNFHRTNYYTLEISYNGLKIMHTSLPSLNHVWIPEYSIVNL